MALIFSTDRLLISHLEAAHFEDFLKMNQDEEIMKYYPNLLSKQETIDFFDRVNNHFKQHGFSFYAVSLKSTQQFIGCTGFMIPTFEAYFTPCVEIGWRYQKEYWGKGYATEGANACLKYGKEQLKFKEVVSMTSVQNKKFEAVMQKIGMQKQGNFLHPKLDQAHWLSEHVLYSIEL